MSEKQQQDEQQRVSKREFIARVSSRSRIPVKTVNRVYDKALAELLDIVTRGDQLMLTGFGKFYPQAHKGHRVQFAEGGETQIDDYYVLKFSATRSVNKTLAQGPVDRDADEDASSQDEGSMSWEEEEDTDQEDQDRYGPEDPAEQDALFDTKPRVKAKPKPKAKPEAVVSASVAAAAVQSTRATKRTKRQAGQGAPSDRAI